jgi:hypothetical protein
MEIFRSRRASWFRPDLEYKWAHARWCSKLEGSSRSAISRCAAASWGPGEGQCGRQTAIERFLQMFQEFAQTQKRPAGGLVRELDELRESRLRIRVPVGIVAD